MRDRTREVGVFAAGLVAGVVLALLLPIVISKISGLVPDSDDPLDYVTVVDPTAPISPRLSAVAKRLDLSTDVDWRATLLERSTVVSRRSTLTPAALKALEKSVTVPDAEQFELLGVVSNLDSPKSVRTNGAFYMVALSRQAPAETWLREDHRIFADDAMEKTRVTYQAGALIFYYAPVGTADYSQAIRRYVGEVVRCPRDTSACPE
ncbi:MULTISPECIES: hypothetical protein [unclassified Nocardioides]|uniref:hypothetical protein n=1 Tax=unclassified Nocardioides TaxID=2615069 RepID=UPI0006FD89DC|nr:MULTISPECIES: hypothetical protein [unclassified Nocardioides]KQY57055.1 hypothetical protein ASD30_12395 [Nocardioides sp. Root140]KRF11695.1 hypothetical protein ASH02_17040 [Nocardioides sp. Soil796]